MASIFFHRLLNSLKERDTVAMGEEKWSLSVWDTLNWDPIRVNSMCPYREIQLS